MFVAVAEELHFGRAAGRLFLSPASVTESVKQLEREFGVAVFIRTSRTVELTVAGEKLLARAQQVLRDVSDLKQEAALLRDESRLRPVRRPVSIGLQCAGLAELNSIVVSVVAQRLGVAVNITEITFEELFSAADTKAYDAIFGTADVFPDRDGVTFMPLYFDTSVVVVNPRSELCDAAALSIEDVLGRPTLDVGGLPAKWAAPFGMTALANGAALELIGDPPADSRHAAAMAQRLPVAYVSAMSDRLMPNMPSVPRIPVLNAPPICFGVYTFDAAESETDSALIAQTITRAARQTAQSFIDLVPGARQA